MKKKSLLMLFLLAPVMAFLQGTEFENALNFGGTPGEQLINAICIDADGNTITTGYFTEEIDLDPGADEAIYTTEESHDIFIQKLSPSGDFLWGFGLGSTGYDRGIDVITDEEGNIYATGHFEGTVDFDNGPETVNLTSVGGNYDCYLIKLSPLGELIWAKSISGTGNEGINRMQFDNNGDLICVGGHSFVTDFDPGAETEEYSTEGFSDLNAFILKLTADGEFVWVKTLGSSGRDEALNISIDPFNSIVVTGSFVFTVDFNPGVEVVDHLSNGTEDAFVLKLDTDGDYIWSKTFGGEEHELGYGLDTDASGNVYVTGPFSETVDFNPEAAIESRTAPLGSGIYVLKLNADGLYQWVVTEGGIGINYGSTVAISPANNVVVAGVFSGEMDIDPSGETITLTSNGNEDAFFQVLNSSGELINGKSWGSTGSDGVTDFAINGFEGAFFSGIFQNTVDFDPGPDTYELTSDGAVDIFITNLSGFLSIEENEDSDPISIFPNPTSGFIAVTNDQSTAANVTIYSLEGKEARRYVLSPGNNTLNLVELPSGVYILKIGDRVARFVKE